MSGNENTGTLRSFIMNVERQCAWEEFMCEYIHRPEVLCDDDILDFIQSIRHFTLMDHYFYQPCEAENLSKALHYMCCIAYDLASDLFRDEDEPLRESLTKNLFLCIKSIHQTE
jgi:hypothetical protein